MLLYAVCDGFLDITWLLQHHDITDAFHSALVELPLGEQPTGLALLARLGTLDHVGSKEWGTRSPTASCQHQRLH